MKKDPRSISFRRAGRNRKSIPGTVRRKQARPATASPTPRGAATRAQGSSSRSGKKGLGSARSAPAGGGPALPPVRP
ncbi:Hypothetical Protein RSKD131_1695 [Cereibacter sphaeroides KD131]|nr:Hypothetical Protein RSKD131_1695 [Cereibacter sphaeroides KD131]